MVAARFPRPDVPAMRRACRAASALVAGIAGVRRDAIAGVRRDALRCSARVVSVAGGVARARTSAEGRAALGDEVPHRAHRERHDEGEDRPHQGPDAPSQPDRRSGDHPRRVARAAARAAGEGAARQDASSQEAQACRGDGRMRLLVRLDACGGHDSSSERARTGGVDGGRAGRARALGGQDARPARARTGGGDGGRPGHARTLGASAHAPNGRARAERRPRPAAHVPSEARTQEPGARVHADAVSANQRVSARGPRTPSRARRSGRCRSRSGRRSHGRGAKDVARSVHPCNEGVARGISIRPDGAAAGGLRPRRRAVHLRRT